MFKNRYALSVACLLAVSLVVIDTARAAEAASAADQAVSLLETAGTSGGLIVHLGCGEGKLTAALGESERFLVQGLDRDEAAIASGRATLLEKGNYGRVSLRVLRGDRLPYVDQSVNLLVVEEPLGVPRAELQRVLAPLGTLLTRTETGWRKQEKPWPDDIDEWTHFLHGPDNNAVAEDRVVGPPKHLQWFADPIHLRTHEQLNSISALVSARGRIFYIIDEGPVAAVTAPPKWRLVARDAFNGKLLWKHDLGPWEGHFRLFRSGPPDIARRLVASADEVYVTLGYGKQVAALDAATGKTLRVYDGTDGAIEILHDGGQLYVLLGHIDEEAYAKAAKIYYPSPPPRQKGIVALDASSGQLLWRLSTDETHEIMPATMAVADGRLFFQNTKRVICLDATSGNEQWRAERPVYTTRLSWSTPTLVVKDGVVMSADGSTGGVPDDVRRGEASVRWLMSDQDIRHHPKGDVFAFDTATGKRLWDGEALEGFCSPGDLFVIDGRVWSGAKVSPSDQTLNTALSLKTGDVLSRSDNPLPVAGHTRCYRNKATERFLVLGAMGVEFVDVNDWSWTLNEWVRGTCQYGVMPCNGLLYVPPDSCACRPNVRLHGFSAMAPARDQDGETEDEGQRLEQGPAFGKEHAKATGEAAWPTYRRDNQRSGRTAASVNVKVRPTWQTDLGGRLTAPTVADGKVFLARVDAHTVHALDADSGKVAWSYTADGPVDSPPTIADGLAVFGCHDGNVYCLDAETGTLVWRYRAAPHERVLLAQEQLESPWPVNGSVLVEDGRVWYVAGRSSYLDGGLVIGALELTSGKPVVERTLNGRDADQWITAVTGPDKPIRNRMPGTRPDILSSKGKLLFMGWACFDREGKNVADVEPHLFSATGFLDDTWWHRTYWQYGVWMRGGFGGWPQAARSVPAARLIVLADERLYGFGRQEYDAGNPEAVHAGHIGVIKDTYQDSGRVDYSQNRYRLFAAPKPTAPEAARRGQKTIPYFWQTEVPILARGMVLAGDALWIAGPKAKEKNEGLAELTTSRPGALMAVSPTDGKTLSEQPLEAAPVLDGMVVMPGHLILSCTDGRVRCFSGD